MIEVDSSSSVASASRLLASAPGERPDGWKSWKNVQDAFAAMLRKKIDELKRTTLGTGEIGTPAQWDGRGIVTAGGGGKLFPSLWVLLNRIRQVGCKLPVEVWHLGRAEIDDRMRELIEGIGGVELIDATKVQEQHPCRILAGWELKPFSMLHSKFAEVLFLDADNAPLRDPAYLFDWPDYCRAGAALWPDYPSWTFTPKKWKRWGLEEKFPRPHAGKRDDWRYFGRIIPADAEPPVESGQVLVNKAQCWRELALTLFLCEFSDYTFGPPRTDLLYGDKEAFHLGWRLLGSPYAVPLLWPDWDDHTELQHDGAGEVVFLHRTRDKWHYQSDKNKRAKDVPGEAELFDIAAKLSKVWNGKVWENSEPSALEKECIAALSQTCTYKRVGHDERKMVFHANGSIGEGSAEMERRWSVWVKPAGPTLAIHGDKGLTALLSLGADGVWRGRWEQFEKCPVELHPAEKIGIAAPAGPNSQQPKKARRRKSLAKR